MKAIAISKFGGADQLKEMVLPKPEPGKGQILVKVMACGANPVDYKIREGAVPLKFDFPLVLGYDCSGVVESVGEDVVEFSAGDEVYYTPELQFQGAYADYHVVEAAIATLKPVGLSHVEAAAVPLAGCTAWQALFDRAQLKTGQVVLIHGGAGGVGSMAVQLASWAGAEVFATAGPGNQEFLEDLGADIAINYQSENFVQVVNEVTRGEGVDVVFDTVGGDVLLQSFEALSPGGVVVSIVPENMGNRPLEGITPAFFKNATLHCHFMERRRDTLDALARLLERGLIEPVVDEVMPLDRAGRAHERMETGHGRGKIVLEVEKG